MRAVAPINASLRSGSRAVQTAPARRATGVRVGAAPEPLPRALSNNRPARGRTPHGDRGPLPNETKGINRMRSTFRATLLVVFATSALAFSAASALAAPHEFVFAGAAGTNWTATQQGSQAFTLNLGRIECGTGGLTGIIPAGRRAPSVKAVFSYGSCLSAGFRYTWTVTDCEYEFHEPTLLGGTEYRGTLSIVKGPGTAACKTVLESSICQVTIEPQTMGGHLTYSPVGTSERFAYEITGLKYTEKGENCFNGPGTFTTGHFAGNMEAKEVSIS